MKQRSILSGDDVIQPSFWTPANADATIQGIGSNATGDQVFPVGVGGLGNKTFADGKFVFYSGGRMISSEQGPSNFSAAGHTHDDRYYTETEMDSRFEGTSAGKYQVDYARITNAPVSGSMKLYRQPRLLISATADVGTWTLKDLTSNLAEHGLAAVASSNIAVLLKVFQFGQYVRVNPTAYRFFRFHVAGDASLVSSDTSIRTAEISMIGESNSGDDNSYDCASGVSTFLVPLSDLVSGQRGFYWQVSHIGALDGLILRVHLLGFQTGVSYIT